jgi:RHS repeat-associated protein
MTTMMNRTRSLVVSFVAAAGLVLAAPALAVTQVTDVYFHNDLAGTPVAATASNGALLWKQTYKPYGERIDPKAPAELQPWYSGKPHVQAAGISYFGARWYDPQLGRFMGVDPKGFDEGNIHSFNRFAYANNNPYKYVDPDGREAFRALGLAAYPLGVLADAASQYAAFGEVDFGMAATSSSAKAGAVITGMTLATMGMSAMAARLAPAVEAEAAVAVEGRALLNATPVQKALKDDAMHRSATFMREEAATSGTHFPITGGDGIQRTLTQISGKLNEQAGRFEYIVEKSGNLTHQRFVPNGTINGVPNVP